MKIELIYKNKKAVRTQLLSDVTQDLDEIVNVQFIDYNRSDIQLIEQTFGIETTILDSGSDIEISSHYLENDAQIGINFSVPYFKSDSQIHEETVCIIFKDNKLFTFTPVGFDEFITDKQKQSHFDKFNGFISTDTYFLTIVGFFADYFADLTEIVSKKIKANFSEILKENKFSEQELDKITMFSFNNLIIEESVNEYRRILHLFRRSNKLSNEIKDGLSVELTDLTVITEYIQNNFERIDDLKENISSKIELEQNRIFKTLTIVTMCISLPTLIAGIYGMNFKYIPELEWDYGYVYVLIIIVLSFSLPLIWFKKKKWL
jgi:magnesium transporter